MSELFPISAFSYHFREDVAEYRAAEVGSVVIGLPWAMIQPHEAQAQLNHSQSLKRLAERGGLSACEALAILDNRRWGRMSRPAAMAELSRRVAAFAPPAPADRSEGWR